MKKILMAAGVMSCLMSAGASAQQPAASTPAATPPAGAPAPMPPPRGPGFDLALEAAHAAFDLCHAQGHDIGVVVADSTGGIKVALVPDTKPSRVVNNAVRKIAMALEFKQNSGDVQALSKTDQALADRIAANSNFMNSAGAVLMKVGDEIVGAIAGSGAKSDEDAACAQAGLDKIKARLK